MLNFRPQRITSVEERLAEVEYTVATAYTLICRMTEKLGEFERCFTNVNAALLKRAGDLDMPEMDKVLAEMLTLDLLNRKRQNADIARLFIEQVEGVDPAEDLSDGYRAMEETRSPE